MRIIYYIDSLYIGGAERLVADHLLILKKRKYDVLLVVNYLSNSFIEKELIDSGINVISLYKNTKLLLLKKIINNLRIVFRLKWRKIIRRFKPNIININSIEKRINFMPFDFNKVFFTFHTDIERLLSMCKKSLIKRIRNLSNKGMRFIAISKKNYYDILNYFQTNNVYYIPNGIDCLKIRNEKYDKKWLENNFYISQNNFILGHVARFNPVKNHKKVLEVFNEYHKINNNSYLLLIGETDTVIANKIKEFAQKEKIDKFVKILGNRDDAKKIMGCFDCFILPSIKEGMPLVALEAQVFGIPTLLSSTISSDVVINENCYQLDINFDSKKWAEKINEIIKIGNTNTCNDFKYDINEIMNEVISLYEEVNNGKK